MPKGHNIDVERLHESLFDKADRLGRLKLKQSEVAVELGITKFTMSRTVTKLIEQGRMKLLTKNRNNRGLFYVTDPEEWHLAFDDEDDDDV